MLLALNEDKIIWPGGLTQKPTGLMIPTHLKVLTILDKPFVYERHIANGETCDSAAGEILCPHYNTEKSHQSKFIPFLMRAFKSTVGQTYHFSLNKIGQNLKFHVLKITF